MLYEGNISGSENADSESLGATSDAKSCIWSFWKRSYLSTIPCESWLKENGDDGGGLGPPMNEELLLEAPEGSRRGFADIQSAGPQADFPTAGKPSCR